MRLTSKFYLTMVGIRSWWADQAKRYVKIERTVITDQNAEEAAQFDLRLKIAPLMQELLPSYCTCQRCKWPYPLLPFHSTRYTISSSCFPLCELCWRQLSTPEARMPFYRAMYEMWIGQGGCSDERWTHIEAAVKAEGVRYEG